MLKPAIIPIKKLISVTILFIVVTLGLILSGPYLNQVHVSQPVLIVGNVLLYIISTINIMLISKASTHKNTNHFYRTIIVTMLIKLFGIAGSVTIFLVLHYSTENVYGVIGCMLLYVIYTIIETKVSLNIVDK